MTDVVWDVFVAYAHPDRERARELVDALVDRGVKVCFDQDVLELGDNWHVLLPKYIEASSIVVALISKHTEAGHFAGSELIRAIKLVGQGRRLAPLLLDPDAEMPYGTDQLHALPMFDSEAVESVAGRIVRLVHGETSSTPSRSEPGPSASVAVSAGSRHAAAGGDGIEHRQAVACSSLVPGHWEVYVHGLDGALRHRWWWPEPGWSKWHDMTALPHGKFTCLAAGSHHDRHQELVAGASDGSVFHRWNWLADDDVPAHECRSEWSEWFEMPAVPGPVRSIACSSLGTGHLEVFVICGDGTIRHRWWWDEAGWSDWEDIPAPPRGQATTIAAGSHHARHQELVVGCDDGSVHHRWNWLADDEATPARQRRSEWSFWHPMPSVPGPVVSAACSSMTTGHLEVFVLCGDDVIRRRWWWDAPGWSDWVPSRPLPQGRPVAIAAGSHDPGHHELIGVSANDAVLNRWFLQHAGGGQERTDWAWLRRSPRG